MDTTTTIAVIVGNRSFFPAHLIKSGREAIIKTLKDEGISCITLGLEDTLNGGVSNLTEARKCADLLKSNREKIDGILITLPNFGDERAVADSIRLSGLNVPILVHAFNDDASRMTSADRRDSFCGKMSVCNNLSQYGIPFTLTRLHTVDPVEESFIEDLRNFAATCRVVRGMRKARIGALGARPQAFKTVRYSEKLLEINGIDVDTLDLSEAFGRASRIKEDEAGFKAKVKEIKEYAVVQSVPSEALARMAKFALVIDRWMEDEGLDATAIQCWTSIEQYYGITPCTVMSMMSNKLIPSACETDVTGVLSMYAMLLASKRPSVLLDWNNNYGSDPDKTVVFHCSNLPADIFEQKPVMNYSEIFSNDVGKNNAYGTLAGRIKAGPFTYCRISTDDINGGIQAYVGEGKFTEDKLDTFGGFGVAEVPDLQGLIRYICLNSFEHHVAVNPGRVADAVENAMATYLGWDIYRHS